LVTIEETFKVMKSDLEGRPVYVWTDAHIRAHFLTCFLSLIILRLLQKKMDWKYSAEAIITALKSADSQEIQGNIYLLSHQNDVFKEICSVCRLDLNFEYMKEEKIRNTFKKYLGCNFYSLQN
jgi:transposase